jgi:putative heme-binding domain-containing protein
MPLAKQPETTQLALLRAASLCLIRLDENAIHTQLAKWALPALDSVDSPICREAARLLVRVAAPEATAKLVHLMQTAKSDLKIRDDLASRDGRGYVGVTLTEMKKQPPPSAQMYYAMLLRHAKSGWTPASHTALAEWLVHAENQAGGRSYRGFVQRIRRDVLKDADNKTREIYAMAEAKRATVELKIVPPKGPGRAWTVAEVEKVMSKPLTGRDFANGKNMYAATLCAQCHQFQGEGGAVGPDLTQLGTRFSARDIAEAIIHPSKAIAEQYESMVFHVGGNETIVGRIASEDKREYQVMINPFDLSQTMPIRKKRVTKKAPSTTSLMPPALINALNEDELKDLFAYLISGGNAQDKMFK